MTKGKKKRPATPKLTDDQRLEMFMQSIHVLTQKPYWPEIRKLGNVSRYGQVHLQQIPGSPVLYMRESQMDPVHADLAGAYMRKYITGRDEISLDKVLLSGERKFGPSEGLAEAKFQWEQVADKPFNFMVQDGKVVEHVIDLPADMTRVHGPSRGDLVPASLTIRDFSQVFFYDGFLHAQDHKSNEGKRPLVRSIPTVLRTIMSHMAISGSVYASVILHHVIAEAAPQWCPADCQEMPIVRQNVASVCDDNGTD